MMLSDFLEDLAEKSLPQANKDLSDLQAFADEVHGIKDLQSWDIGLLLRENASALLPTLSRGSKNLFPRHSRVTRVVCCSRKIIRFADQRN